MRKLLFKVEFNKLKTSRSFESWVNDILINPVATASSLDRFDKLYQNISLDDYRYYSGSPSFDNSNMYKWYKNTENKDIQSIWHKNLSFFITGKRNINFTNDELKFINQLTKFMLDYSCGIIKKDIFKIIDNFKNDIKHPILIDVLNILKIANNKDHNKIINAYLNSKAKIFWGMPQHHIVLSKIS